MQIEIFLSLKNYHCHLCDLQMFKYLHLYTKGGSLPHPLQSLFSEKQSLDNLAGLRLEFVLWMFI